MSQFVVPSWNLKHQRQDQVDGGEGMSRPFHVHSHQNTSYVVPMSTDFEVTELTWENGQLSMHGLSNVIPSPAPNKLTTVSSSAAAACGRPGDHTLESIVHQATCHNNHNHKYNPTMQISQKKEQPSTKDAATNSGKWGEKAGQVQMLPPNTVKKRVRTETESDQCGRYLSSGSGGRMHDLGAERSACASAGATFCRDNNRDATLMTWASSFDSFPASFKTNKTTDDDSAASHGGGLENLDEEQETKGGTPRTCSARRSRAAAIHNQSERRRRDRINQKMKALQKLVPNASKTDKASMLDEVIDYLKQLQAQVHMMSTRTIMPQMMINPLPLAIQQQQQHLQMSLLAAARMAMPGVGLGMLDVNAMARATPPSPPPPSLQSLITSTAPLATTTPAFLPPPFVVPPVIPVSGANAATAAATVTTAAMSPFSNPYSAFLAQQTENMEFYGKMAALYRQHQANQTRSSNIVPIPPNFNPGK